MLNRTGMKIRGGPSGLHLFDRETGTNILFDEISMDVCRWSLAPRHVSISLLNACDLSCSHCYAPKHRSVLDVGKVMEWLKLLDLHGALGVGFGGGEPTLHPEFERICIRCFSETSLAISFTTHGHHLSEDLLKRISESVSYVRVSMDGVGLNYEKIRKRSFNSLLSKIEILSRFCAFGINFVVNDKTVSDLAEVEKIAQGLGATQLLLLPQRGTSSVKPIDDRSRRVMEDWIIEYAGSLTLVIGNADNSDLPLCDPFKGESPLSSYVYIDSDGILKGSSFENIGVPIGNGTIMDAVAKLGKLKR